MMIDSRWAVFVSAGDNNNVLQWIKSESSRTWDLIVAYYGENAGLFEQVQQNAQVCYKSKGGKFQNLKRLYLRQPGLLNRYDYIFVCDDDLVFEKGGITKAFQICQQFEFWVAQPAFSLPGKLSHPITQKIAGSDVRLVNFVEVTCPLFRADKLVEFLNVYDGELAGFGIDWWFCNHFVRQPSCRLAIIDCTTVVNPHDASKGLKIREIDTLQPTDDRVKDWRKSQASFGYKQFEQKTIATIVFD